MSQNHTQVDTIFDCLCFSENQKIAIYQLLAAIIHLSNIEFESKESNSEAQVKESSKAHINSAAILLKVSVNELQSVLLHRSIDVPGSEIT